jgi:hypothetical protein
MKNSFPAATTRYAAFLQATASISFIPQQEVDMRERQIDDSLLSMGEVSPAVCSSVPPAMNLRPCWIMPSVRLIPRCSPSRCGAKLPARRIPANLFGICFERPTEPFFPNTAGCLSPHEAIKTACMARELFQTDLIKLEIIGDEVSFAAGPFRSG